MITLDVDPDVDDVVTDEILAPSPRPSRAGRSSERPQPPSGEVATPTVARSRKRADHIPPLSQPDFRDLMESAPVAAFVKDRDGRYVYANPHLLATMGKYMGPDWLGKTDADLWPPEAAAMMRKLDDAALGGLGPQVFSRGMPLEDGPHTVLLTQFRITTGNAQIGVGGIGVDITEYALKGAERDRLAAAIGQTTDSVMIVDLEGRITYVNPAFERATGYGRDEVIGQNPRILKSGVQTPWFYDAMWATLASGLPWASDIVNRRKDGSLFTEEASISPIRDAAGAITSFVAVKRDVTQERALAERATQLIRERALIADTIRGLRAGDTSPETAQAICRQVVNLTGVMATSLLLFESDGHALTIGFVVAGQPDPPLHRIPKQRSQHLRERAAEGPWIEPWANTPEHPHNELVTGLRSHSMAYAPVRDHDRLIGVLVIDSDDTVRGTAVTDVLTPLVEFADLAGALIGRDVSHLAEAARNRDHIAGIIAHRAFRPVFQPIVDLGRDAIVGYEALTRFDDGASPESIFAEAHEVAMGLELELATLDAALAAAEGLPQSAWLNLNASPELILAGKPLRSLLHGCQRHLVLEVTEHTAIADYAAFRAAMAALGSNVELAVDDAGVGFASLRHILELHPAFVKLDRWLITGLEADEARKAMIVGLIHFARSTGCRLIAEGVETDREFAALRSLNVQLGQGYLLGRPAPAPTSLLTTGP